MRQRAIVVLFRNETHNWGITYILEQGYAFLDANFTVPLEVKETIDLIIAPFRTGYNMSEPQLKRLKEKGKVQ